MLARYALLLSLAISAPALAREPWQLSHGPFTTASDVREHNQLGADLRDLDAFLKASPPAWASALELYAYGKNFPKHSLLRFGDDYNGRLSGYLSRATQHFGSPSFQAHAWTAALGGSGRFARSTAAERIAFIDGAAPALVINWARYELGEAQRKAKASPANWALNNGAPKNWNEIFAFYLGPDGKHAGFAAVEGVEGGKTINQALFAALARGQDALVKQNWPESEAAAVAAALDKASLALLRDALEKAVSAGAGKRPAALRRISGAWLAASEPLLADAAAAKALEAALAGNPDQAAIEGALKAVKARLGA
jgi:hypothetical protein